MVAWPVPPNRSGMFSGTKVLLASGAFPRDRKSGAMIGRGNSNNTSAVAGDGLPGAIGLIQERISFQLNATWPDCKASRTRLAGTSRAGFGRLSNAMSWRIASGHAPDTVAMSIGKVSLSTAPARVGVAGNAGVGATGTGFLSGAAETGFAAKDWGVRRTGPAAAPAPAGEAGASCGSATEEVGSTSSAVSAKDCGNASPMLPKTSVTD